MRILAPQVPHRALLGGDALSGVRLPWFRLRIDHLYLLLPLSALGTLVGLAPLVPHDFWWHLRVGQLIAEQGRIPQTVLFAWTVPPDAPYIYGEWLAEWLFYAQYTLGGTDLVIFARNLLAVAAFALVGLEARRRAGSWRLAALAVALAAALTLDNLNVRPQNWTWLLVALYLLLLGHYTGGALRARWLAGLPILMVAWVNLHGGFVLGILMVGAAAVGEPLRCRLGCPGALDRRGVLDLWMAAAATAAATLANPRGPGIFAYVRDHVLHPASRQLGADWAPPTPEGFPNGLFYLTVLLLLGALAYARRRPTPSDLLLTGGFLWLAWSGQRYIVWYAMAAMPLLVQCLAAGSVARRQSRTQPESESELQPDPRDARCASVVPTTPVVLLNWAIALALLVPVVAAQPWFNRALPLPPEYRALVYGAPAPPLLATATPLGGVEFLRAHPGGRLFHELGYGSYLIWALPDVPVFIDPRMQPYPSALFDDYLRISQGERAAELLAYHDADRVLLSLRDQSPLSLALATAPAWHCEYADAWSEVWRQEPASRPTPG